MQDTNISWATYSWNPVTGCSRQGPECFDPKTGTLVCYAEVFHRRQSQREDAPEFYSDREWTQENASEVVTMHPDRLEEPDEYRFPDGPGRVFVGSMTDMFHREVDPEFTQRVLEKCRQFPEHIWIFLTKRPGNAAEWGLEWPENCWLGTSVGSGPGGEYADTTHRIDRLREVDIGTRWVSFEPLIEPVGDVELSGIEWAVVGGETREDAVRREMDHEWARDIYQQCLDQDVRFFFKQSSARYPETGERLTVKNADHGCFEQRKIREYPDLPAVTKEARTQHDADRDGEVPA